MLEEADSLEGLAADELAARTGTIESEALPFDMPPESLTKRDRDSNGAPPGSLEVPGAAEQKAGAAADARSAYLASVAARLHAAKRYPADARRFGVQGTAVVAFRVEANGTATGVRVEESSGDRQLDGEAVAMVRRASPFAPIPNELGGQVLCVTVPVAFIIHE